MSGLERVMRGFRSGYDAPLEPGTIAWQERIEMGSEQPPYQLEGAERFAAAENRTREYRTLGDPELVSLDDRNVPRPPSVFRQVPPV